MKTSRLSDQDRQECDDAFQTAQAQSAEFPKLALRTGVFAAILLVSLGGEYCLSYSVVLDAIGPLPGEPWSPVPAIVALSGMIAVAAFALHRRLNAASVPARLVSALAGYAALGFVLVMGAMLAKLIYMNMSGADIGGALFGSGNAPAETSFLSRLFEQISGPFAVAFGAVTLCNLYIAEYALGKLRETLKELLERRTLVTAAGAAMNELEESERELARLDIERQQILRSLEPKAAYEFSNDLSCVIAEARSPIEQWIMAQQLRKKPAASVLSIEAEPDIDIAKLEKIVAGLRLDSKVIYAAFRGEEKEKK